MAPMKQALLCGLVTFIQGAFLERSIEPPQHLDVGDAYQHASYRKVNDTHEVHEIRMRKVIDPLNLKDGIPAGPLDSPGTFKIPKVAFTPTVNEKNVLATQVAELYHEDDCKGPMTAFESSANEAAGGFQKYIHNLWSVKLCGMGTFFYFSAPDMMLLSTLGHVSRCDNVTKSVDECECANIKPDKRKLVESFSLQYC